MKWTNMAILAVTALCSCGTTSTGRSQMAAGQVRDYRMQVESRNQAFYTTSVIIVVNASRYQLHIIRDGFELPIPYGPYARAKLMIRNYPQKNRFVIIEAVAHDDNGRRVGAVKKIFCCSGTGIYVIEQWVIRDRMFPPGM